MAGRRLAVGSLWLLASCHLDMGGPILSPDPSVTTAFRLVRLAPDSLDAVVLVGDTVRVRLERCRAESSGGWFATTRYFDCVAVPNVPVTAPAAFDAQGMASDGTWSFVLRPYPGDSAAIVNLSVSKDSVQATLLLKAVPFTDVYPRTSTVAATVGDTILLPFVGVRQDGTMDTVQAHLPSVTATIGGSVTLKWSAARMAPPLQLLALLPGTDTLVLALSQRRRTVVVNATAR